MTRTSIFIDDQEYDVEYSYGGSPKEIQIQSCELNGQQVFDRLPKWDQDYIEQQCVIDAQDRRMSVYEERRRG